MSMDWHPLDYLAVGLMLLMVIDSIRQLIWAVRFRRKFLRGEFD